MSTSIGIPPPARLVPRGLHLSMHQWDSAVFTIHTPLSVDETVGRLANSRRTQGGACVAFFPLLWAYQHAYAGFCAAWQKCHQHNSPRASIKANKGNEEESRGDRKEQQRLDISFLEGNTSALIPYLQRSHRNIKHSKSHLIPLTLKPQNLSAVLWTLPISRGAVDSHLPREGNMCSVLLRLKMTQLKRTKTGFTWFHLRKRLIQQR